MDQKFFPLSRPLQSEWGGQNTRKGRRNLLSLLMVAVPRRSKRRRSARSARYARKARRGQVGFPPLLHHSHLLAQGSCRTVLHCGHPPDPVFSFKGSLVDPRVRASNEHIPIVRVPRAGGRPGYPSPLSEAARCASTGDSPGHPSSCWRTLSTAC